MDTNVRIHPEKSKRTTRMTGMSVINPDIYVRLRTFPSGSMRVPEENWGHPTFRIKVSKKRSRLCTRTDTNEKKGVPRETFGSVQVW